MQSIRREDEAPSLASFLVTAAAISRSVSSRDREYCPVLVSPQASENSIQNRIKCFLLSVEGQQWMKTGGCLIQFWAPAGSTSKILSVSEQPFGVGQITDQLCRYRSHCIQYEHARKDMSEEVDPIGRSFARGSPEFSPNIDSYSNEEFPLRNQALKCGFQGYLALPLFENKQPLCVGVLEILCLGCWFCNSMVSRPSKTLAVLGTWKARSRGPRGSCSEPSD